jgi:dTMP kinase
MTAGTSAAATQRPRPRRARGFFVTLEGPEGSGKTTQGRRLVHRLRRRGVRVVWLRDPGSTALGRTLRRMLLDRAAAVSPMAEALLFIGGRAHLAAARIRPALARGAVVVCDRFHDSTVAYQGFGGGLNVPWLNRLGRAAIHGLMPQVTIVLDVPTAKGFARLRRRRDRMERKGLSFHRRVREGFLRLARQEPQRFVVIKAAGDPGAVQRTMTDAVLSHLARRASVTPPLGGGDGERQRARGWPPVAARGDSPGERGRWPRSGQRGAAPGEGDSPGERGRCPRRGQRGAAPGEGEPRRP